MPVFGGISLLVLLPSFLLLPSRLQQWRQKNASWNFGFHDGYHQLGVEISQASRALGPTITLLLLLWGKWVQSYMSPCFHGTLIMRWRVQIFFYLGKLGKNGCLPVLKCKDVFGSTFLMMKKSPESFHRKPVVIFFRRRMYPQTSGCIAIPVNRKGFAISPFRWGCLKRHLSNDSEPRSWNKQDQTQLVDLILPELGVSHKSGYDFWKWIGNFLIKKNTHTALETGSYLGVS